MDVPSIRIALDPAVTRDDVETAAWDTDLFIYSRTDAANDQPREDIWRTFDSKNWLHEIEDHIIGLTYLVAKGEDYAKLEAQLRKRLKTVTYTDALGALKRATSQDDKILWLYQLGIAARAAGKTRILTVFSQALQDENATTRQAALISLAYTEWTDLKNIVQDIGETDEDTKVSSTAKGLLGAYQAKD